MIDSDDTNTFSLCEVSVGVECLIRIQVFEIDVFDPCLGLLEQLNSIIYVRSQGVAGSRDGLKSAG